MQLSGETITFNVTAIIFKQNTGRAYGKKVDTKTLLNCLNWITTMNVDNVKKLYFVELRFCFV